MALALYFSPSSFAPETYDEVLKRLEAAGAGAPPGRVYHAALEGEGGIHVFDVWESQEQFEEFGKTLLPILSELEVDPGKPYEHGVYNVIHG